MRIRVCRTYVEPDDIPVFSSKSDDLIYFVTPSSPFNDAVCECPGYVYRGYCRHIREVEEERCRWLTTSKDPINRCPNCGNKAVEFDLEAHYV